MPVIKCPLESCTYKTPDVDASVAASLLIIHNNVHINENSSKLKPPKMDRPRIGRDCSEEGWNIFRQKWTIFKDSMELTEVEKSRQLYQCCEEDLGDAILRGHEDIVNLNEQELLKMIKQLAVVPVSVVVRRTDFLSTKQDLTENTRSFAARLKGKASTCSYTCKCPKDGCNQIIDFTDIILKDVMVTGLADEDIRKEVLGWGSLDEKDVNETIGYIESKEMARDAMTKPAVTASVSSYKSSRKTIKRPSGKITCNICGKISTKFTWSRKNNKYIECSTCKQCWIKSRKKDYHGDNKYDETNALLIGGSYTKNFNKVVNDNINVVKLDHYVFDCLSGWKESKSLKHPTIQLKASIDKQAYTQMKIKCPKQNYCTVNVVTDTGAQSCLWDLSSYLKHGFKKSNLIPVKRKMVAANREQIKITGAIFMELRANDVKGKLHVAKEMVYISPCTDRFFLSRNACVKLGIISRDFPRIGATIESCTVHEELQTCDCIPRTPPPDRPKELPFACIPANNQKMREWLLNRYASSTFNKCTHQLLPEMTGPPLKIHIDPDAIPKAISTASPIPKHWEKAVKETLDRDTRLGVLGKTPVGVPSTWVHRMVVVAKADGSCRRVVDLSPLNKYCVRETHHVKPPFIQVCEIPANTWKSVTDAWNGFHSVPLRLEDHHLTTFLTPWGRYYYKVAPQGYLASGDAYTRRYDEIIVDIPRKTKCVDDTVLWDMNLADHWWRMIDYLDLMAKNGVVLNPEKFQFAQKEINFAGFTITKSEIKPQEKFVNAIRDFPIPKSITDVRSWFGLVHQVSHYNQLTSLMTVFKPLLSPKTKFYWNDKLDDTFYKSKEAIVAAITKGIQIFDLGKPTCIQPDWSTTGIGYFLSQKHCSCSSAVPGCCQTGWRIVLAGSRFLRPSESRYAAVEGESLAIVWALEQSRYFTQGCDNLLVLTDHKPLVKLFGDRTLDEIANPRLFRLKQRSLLWRFKILHKPGKLHLAPDAMSRHPVETKDEVEISASEILAGIRLPDSECIIASNQVGDNFRAVTFDRVKEETLKDNQMLKLIHYIQAGFPETKDHLPLELHEFWIVRYSLFIIDGVIMCSDRKRELDHNKLLSHSSIFQDDVYRIVIPPSLRKEVISVLHSAHQGVTAMNERARSIVYWPGITNDIQRCRENCNSCNLIAPSNPRLPPIEPLIPKVPFESIVCDYFQFKGWYYFVAADRLSGWTELQKIKLGTDDSGSKGLCKALRRIFVTFGVPVEISSDGGPEFSAKVTKDFLKRWGIHHRMSSAYHPVSNGRAELAVKASKRLLMENIGSNGELNNDRMIQALLTQRNTPDPGCKLSPAQILLGRNLKDSLPYIRKNVMAYNNPQFLNIWRNAWSKKEEALRSRYVKSLENLSEHTRSLPPLNCGDHVMIQNQTGNFPNKWGKSGIIVELKDYHQYVVKVDGSGRLTIRNRKFLRKFNPPVSKSGGSIPYLRKADIQQQKSVFSGNDEKRDSKRSSNGVRSQKGIHFKAEDNFGKICNTTKPATLLSPEDSNCVDKSQSSNQRKSVSFHFEPNDERNFVDDGVLPEKELRRSGRVRTRRKIYDAESGTYKPV